MILHVSGLLTIALLPLCGCVVVRDTFINKNNNLPAYELCDEVVGLTPISERNKKYSKMVTNAFYQEN